MTHHQPSLKQQIVNPCDFCQLHTSSIVLQHMSAYVQIAILHVATPCQTPVSFFSLQVFHDVLLDLRRVVLSSYILNDNICDPFFVLSELCEYRVDGGNYRPICFLVGGCRVSVCVCVCVYVCVCVDVGVYSCATVLSHCMGSHDNA